MQRFIGNIFFRPKSFSSVAISTGRVFLQAECWFSMLSGGRVRDTIAWNVTESRYDELQLAEIFSTNSLTTSPFVPSLPPDEQSRGVMSSNLQNFFHEFAYNEPPSPLPLLPPSLHSLQFMEEYFSITVTPLHPLHAFSFFYRWTWYAQEVVEELRGKGQREQWIERSREH